MTNKPSTSITASDEADTLELCRNTINLFPAFCALTHDVARMVQQWMFGACGEFQILRPVVEFVAIAVMHEFVRVQRTAEHLLHHDSMFLNLPVTIRAWMRRHINQSVPTGRGTATSPTTMTLAAMAHSNRFIRAQFRTVLAPLVGNVQRTDCELGTALFALFSGVHAAILACGERGTE